jgi:hypothetical protein
MDESLFDPDVQAARDAALLNMVRPSWADPRFSLATNWFRYTSVVVAANVPTRIIAANPLRWSVGICLASAASGKCSFRFDQLVGPDAAFVFTAPGFVFLTVLTHGPVACADIYISSAGASTVGVTEVLIQ